MTCRENCIMLSAAALEKEGIDVHMIDHVMDKYASTKGSLITILQAAQETISLPSLPLTATPTPCWRISVSRIFTIFL